MVSIPSSNQRTLFNKMYWSLMSPPPFIASRYQHSRFIHSWETTVFKFSLSVTTLMPMAWLSHFSHSPAGTAFLGDSGTRVFIQWFPLVKSRQRNPTNHSSFFINLRKSFSSRCRRADQTRPAVNKNHSRFAKLRRVCCRGSTHSAGPAARTLHTRYSKCICGFSYFLVLQDFSNY